MLFITIVLSIPVYIYLIWALNEPEEAYFFLDKWRYVEIPELSDIELKLFKIGNIACIIFMTLIIILSAIS